MIRILRPPNADGLRIEDDVDETLLQCYVGRGENDNDVGEIIEYCLAECADPIHNGPRDVFHPCPKHVQRSVHVTLKKWPEGMGAVAQPLV